MPFSSAALAKQSASRLEFFEALSEKHTTEILEREFVGTWNGQKGVIRQYTPRECLRLMGFSDSFKIVVSDTSMYQQAGNSIVVDVFDF